MLTLLGPRARFCDGVSRRSFLQIGGLAIGGLTLPRAAAGRGRRAARQVAQVASSWCTCPAGWPTRTRST